MLRYFAGAAHNGCAPRCTPGANVGRTDIHLRLGSMLSGSAIRGAPQLHAMGERRGWPRGWGRGGRWTRGGRNIFGPKIPRETAISPRLTGRVSPDASPSRSD